MKVCWSFASNAKSKEKVQKLLHKFEEMAKLDLQDVKIEKYHSPSEEYQYKVHAKTDLETETKNPFFTLPGQILYALLCSVNKVSSQWSINGPHAGYFYAATDSRTSAIRIPGLTWINFELFLENYERKAGDV